MESSLKSVLNLINPFRCINARIGKSSDLLQDIEMESSNQKTLSGWITIINLTMKCSMMLSISFQISVPQRLQWLATNKLKEYETTEAFNDDFGELVPIDISINDFSGEKRFSFDS